MQNETAKSARPHPAGAYISIYDCGAGEEGQPNHRDPCPMCGATVSGNDPVQGRCWPRRWSYEYQGRGSHDLCSYRRTCLSCGLIHEYEA